MIYLHAHVSACTPTSLPQTACHANHSSLFSPLLRGCTGSGETKKAVRGTERGRQTQAAQKRLRSRHAPAPSSRTPQAVPQAGHALLASCVLRARDCNLGANVITGTEILHCVNTRERWRTAAQGAAATDRQVLPRAHACQRRFMSTHRVQRRQSAPGKREMQGEQARNEREQARNKRCNEREMQ